MADKLMYIPNDDEQNYPFCTLQWLIFLDTQRNEPTNQNTTKILKLFDQTNNKTLVIL